MNTLKRWMKNIHFPKLNTSVWKWIKNIHLPKLNTRVWRWILTVCVLVLVMFVSVKIFDLAWASGNGTSQTQTATKLTPTKPSLDKSLGLIRLLWLIPALTIGWLLWGKVRLPRMPSLGNLPQGWSMPKGWWKPFLGFILCNIVLWRVWPEIYGRLLNSELYWINVAVIFFVYTFLRENKKSTTLGSIALILLIIADFSTMGGTSLWQKVSGFSENRSVASPTTEVRNPVFPNIPKDNPVAVATDKFWRENLSEQDAAEMIWIAEKESSFRQFKEDGVTPLPGKEDPEDIGVMQINKTTWLTKAEELGHDVKTLEGNLKMALWIRQTYGPSEWVTYSEARKSVGSQGKGDYVVLAPVGSWKRNMITEGVILRYHGPVLLRDDRGNIFEEDDSAKHNKMSPLLQTAWVDIQSRTTEPVKVTVSR